MCLLVATQVFSQSLDGLEAKAMVCLNKTENYIQERSGDFELQSAFFLDYLVLRNERHTRMSFDSILHAPRTDSFAFKRNMKVADKYMRLKSADSPAPTSIPALLKSPKTRSDSIQNLDAMMIQTLFPLLRKSGLKALIIQNAEAGGYWMTHAAICIAWARELDAPLTLERSEKKAFKKALKRLIRKEEENQDLRFEAMAIYHYLYPQKRYKSSQIKAIIESQEKDGGWSIMKAHNFSSDHTVMLAYWNLLNYLEPERKHFRMLKL